jgi:hypothetical protein
MAASKTLLKVVQKMQALGEMGAGKECGICAKIPPKGVGTESAVVCTTTSLLKLRKSQK